MYSHDYPVGALARERLATLRAEAKQQRVLREVGHGATERPRPARTSKLRRCRWFHRAGVLRARFISP
jgi:hypothetical protein